MNDRGYLIYCGFSLSESFFSRAYYNEFKKQMEADPTKKLRIATIFSYAVNEEETEDLLDEENPESTSGLDQSSRDFLESAIDDYNKLFNTNYSTDNDGFQSYYKDLSLRMKNKEIDLLIVVNMFLTGFDATTLNTLWVDKNLKYHGLIQAFSRTNRILNKIKTFGNIVCFRQLQKRVDNAIALFGNMEAGGVVLLKGFKDYYEGYVDDKGKQKPGYIDMIEELEERFPLSEPSIIGEKNQRDLFCCSEHCCVCAICCCRLMNLQAESLSPSATCKPISEDIRIYAMNGRIKRTATRKISQKISSLKSNL